MSNFLHSVEEQLKSNKDKISVMRELQDHVDTKKEFFQSIGYDKKASAEKANEAMGDGEIIGQRLNKMHRSNEFLTWGIFVILITINSMLKDSYFSENKDFFLHTFLGALVAFAVNLCFSAVTVKRKNKVLSISLIVLSLAPFLARNFPLAYPLCNLIFLNINNDAHNNTYYNYNFFRIVITVFISLLILIPNAFNIYHCRQIKELTNTRKHNEISRFMRNACIIAAVSSLALSVPYYAMNDLICKKQAEFRDSLFDFALDTANEFDYNAWDELAEYLESCEYDFEYNVYNYYLSDPDVVAYRMERYTYRKGDWTVTFTLDEKELKNGYSIDVNHNIDNLSLKYLYMTDESWNELIEKIGHPYDESNNATGLSAQEIRSIMRDFNLTGIEIIKQTDSTVYTYEYLDSFYANRKVLKRPNYQFDCDSNGICRNYKYSGTWI